MGAGIQFHVQNPHTLYNSKKFVWVSVDSVTIQNTKPSIYEGLVKYIELSWIVYFTCSKSYSMDNGVIFFLVFLTIYYNVKIYHFFPLVVKSFY